jgi:hypothetical protein
MEDELINIVAKMASVLDDIIYEPNVIVLGIFGNTNKVSEQDLQDNTLTLILQELGRTPDKVLIPTEGNSSIYIQEWAEALGIKTQAFQADWARNGKIAQILRDDRMSKECTHALVFLSNKSTRLEKFAEKLCKKSKIVFTSSHNQTLTQYEMWNSLLPSQQQALERAHKSSKGKEQTLLKYQKKGEC